MNIKNIKFKGSSLTPFLDPDDEYEYVTLFIFLQLFNCYPLFIPRTGSSSIKTQISRLITRLIDSELISINEYLMFDEESLFDYIDKNNTHLFSVVRNPYTRLFSAVYKTMGKESLKNSESFMGVLNQINFTNNDLGLIPDVFIPQHDFLFCEDVLVPNTILRFETIFDDFKKLWVDVIKPKMVIPDNPLLNQAIDAGGGFKNLCHIEMTPIIRDDNVFYTEEVKKFIQKFYKDDIILYEDGTLDMSYDFSNDGILR